MKECINIKKTNKRSNGNKRKVALITGITGQDGSYLAELLLSKGYKVHGMVYRADSFNSSNINHLREDPLINKVKLFFHDGDLADYGVIRKLIRAIGPDEVYNLGARSHVRESFDEPEHTANVTGLGALRILEAIRDFEKRNDKKIKFYQASSSEMFGSSPPPQNEKTPFHPRSPYASAKVFAFYTTINYREAYNIFAVNGILFNHESPRRNETFVTRKITLGLAGIAAGADDKIILGNLDAGRDWGYSKDFVEGIWRMMQYKEPDDYVLATGELHSIREFAEEAARLIGIELVWRGKGLKEKGINNKTGRTIIAVNPAFFRPAEVNSLMGDYSKVRKKIGWRPKVKFRDLVKIMMDHDLKKYGIRTRKLS